MTRRLRRGRLGSRVVTYAPIIPWIRVKLNAQFCRFCPRTITGLQLIACLVSLLRRLYAQVNDDALRGDLGDLLAQEADQVDVGDGLS